MTRIVVDATYENGMLKLDRRLPLGEHERVRITVQVGLSLAEQTAGLMGWKEPAELAEYFAMDPELVEPAQVDPVADISTGDSSTVADEPSASNDWEMVDIFLKLPPSPTARIVTATRGEIWPSPYVIDESDLTPE